MSNTETTGMAWFACFMAISLILVGISLSSRVSLFVAGWLQGFGVALLMHGIYRVRRIPHEH